MRSFSNIIKISIYVSILLAVILSLLTSSSYAYEENTIIKKDNKVSTDTMILTYKSSDIFSFDFENLRTFGYDSFDSEVTLNLKSLNNNHTYCYYDLYLNIRGNLPDPIVSDDDTLSSPFYYRLSYKALDSFKDRNKTKELITLGEYNKDSLKRLKIVSNGVISTSGEESVLYQFNNLIYKANLETFLDYDEVINGYIDVDVKDCFVKPYTEGLMHYMVLNSEENYVEVDSIPKTDIDVRYTIDSEKTYCVKKGIVLGYNGSLGVVEAPESDECYIYFTKTM